MRRALERVSHSPAVTSALRDERAITAEEVRREIASAHERGGEVFAALAAVLEPLGPTEDKLRVTAGVRASDERWLPVELASERLGDALAGIAVAAERSSLTTADEDEEADLKSALGELGGVQLALTRGVHKPRGGDIVWIERSSSGAVSLRCRAVVSRRRDATADSSKPRRSAVFTSATLAVAGSFAFALERFGLTDIGDARAFGSPFRYDEQAILVVPDDGALPSEPAFAEETAQTITEIGRALDGRTLVLFTAHGSMRDVAARLGHAGGDRHRRADAGHRRIAARAARAIRRRIAPCCSARSRSGRASTFRAISSAASSSRVCRSPSRTIRSSRGAPNATRIRSRSSRCRRPRSACVRASAGSSGRAPIAARSSFSIGARSCASTARACSRHYPMRACIACSRDDVAATVAAFCRS